MKRIQRLGAIIIALFMLIFLVGCFNDEGIITKVEIDPLSISETIDISEFELSDLKLIVTYKDKSVESITVDSNMVSSTDLLKLGFRGTHEITISYEGFDLKVNIVLEDQATLDLIFDYYEFIISASLFSGSYQEWLQSITEEGTLFIRKAHLNNQNQVVITFSNLEVQILGTMAIGSSQLDELILSLDRLKNAQFDVDIQSIFNVNQNTNRVLRTKSLSSILLDATSTQIDDPFNPDDFYMHPLYTEMYYHKNMYTMAEIIDGYHVVTTSLTTYANNAINNMTKGVKDITTRAKDSAYWAVDNIRVADTWITANNEKYLLHYNEILDRVEYYHYQYAEDQKTHYYEKIFIFYNAKGEEVIERYFEYRYEEVYFDGFYGSISYYNSIAGRDFNLIHVWLDEDYKPTNQRMYRGINLNDDGIYEYYENDILMISGENAWYEAMPRIDHENQMVEFVDYRPFTVYSPDGTSNVLTFSKHNNHYNVELYIPAFDGIQAVLVEEGGMYEVQQDPDSVIQEIINKGLEVMPERFEMDVHNEDIMTGFKTANGTFMADAVTDQNGVSIDKVNLYVTREGTYDYQLYHNYLGVIKLSIETDEIDLMFDKLILFMDHIGITYEYGSITDLLIEVEDQYEKRHDMVSNFNYLNPVMGGPEHSFKDYNTYLETHQFIDNYLDQYQVFEEMKELYPTMNYNSMPSWDQIGISTFINIDDHLTGTLSVNESFINTNPILASLKPSILLQENKQYTLFYSLLIDKRLIPIGYEDPQTYKRATLVFEGNQEILFPMELANGKYQFVLFFGKVVEDRFIRVSNIMPVLLEDFEMIEVIVTDEETEYSAIINVFSEDDLLYMNVLGIDLYAPKVMIDSDPTIYQDDTYFIDLSIEKGKTVLDLLSRIEIKDTFEPRLYPKVDFVFKDDLPVLLEDEVLGDGWKLFIYDSSLNSTTILINFIYVYNVIFMVGDEIYQQFLVEEDTLVDLPIEPNLEGYTFIGWDLEDLLITDDTIYHAIFEKNTYTITFETNDGSTIEDITLDYDSDIILPQNPNKEGYTFDGWYIDIELLTEYSYIKMPAKDFIIYAKWQDNS